MVVYTSMYVVLSSNWKRWHIRTVCVWFCLLVLPVCGSCQNSVLYCLCLNIVFSCYSMLLLYCGLCQYMSVLPIYLVCCQWYTKCVPRESIVRGSVSQTANGVLGCGLSVSILRFPLCGVRPRGLREYTIGNIQGGSNMTGTDLYVNKPHCAEAVRPWESEATTSTLPPARVRTCWVLSGSC